MEKERAEKGQGQIPQPEVDCINNCIFYELADGIYSEEDDDGDSQMLAEKTLEELANIISHYTPLLQTFETHCYPRCQRYSNRNGVLLMFTAQLNEARNILASKKPLVEQ